MAQKGTKNPNAGRKKLLDPKDRITLFVPHSLVVGKDNAPMDKDSAEYAEKVEELKVMLMETIEFTRK